MHADLRQAHTCLWRGQLAPCLLCSVTCIADSRCLDLQVGQVGPALCSSSCRTLPLTF